MSFKIHPRATRKTKLRSSFQFPCIKSERCLWPKYCPLIGRKWSRDLDTALCLAVSDHVTWTLPSDWPCIKSEQCYRCVVWYQVNLLPNLPKMWSLSRRLPCESERQPIRAQHWARSTNQKPANVPCLASIKQPKKQGNNNFPWAHSTSFVF